MAAPSLSITKPWHWELPATARPPCPEYCTYREQETGPALKNLSRQRLVYGPCFRGGVLTPKETETGPVWTPLPETEYRVLSYLTTQPLAGDWQDFTVAMARGTGTGGKATKPDCLDQGARFSVALHAMLALSPCATRERARGAFGSGGISHSRYAAPAPGSRCSSLGFTGATRIDPSGGSHPRQWGIQGHPALPPVWRPLQAAMGCVARCRGTFPQRHAWVGGKVRALGCVHQGKEGPVAPFLDDKCWKISRGWSLG